MPSQLKFKKFKALLKRTERTEGNNMKAIGKITITLILMLTISLFLTSCSGIVTPELQLDLEENVSKVEEIDYIYLDVPYERYAGTNWCLPASGAMALHYYKKNISQQQIANIVIGQNGLGNISKMVKYAKELGFESKYCSLTLEEIKNALVKNIPIIAIQDYSLSISLAHARVIIGYDDIHQEIITNDPTIGKDYKISYSNFIKLNNGSNPDLCKVIVISPEEIDIKNVIVESNINNS